VTDTIERDVMQYDVVVVGAGPAGLACAIRLKQMKPDVNVCVLEKASAVGAHSLSGAVLEPGPLEQLLPEWQSEYTGMKVAATEDDFRILTPRGSYKPVPDFAVKLLPQSMTYSTPFNNHGNYIISLGQLTAWLAQKAESLGVEVFPGFAAAEALFDEAGAVKGVRIGDMGLDRDGQPGPNFTPGVEIHAGLTVLAEGARGSVSKTLIARYDLAQGHCPQTFALGFKELWQLPPGRVQPGRIEHALGWPADAHT
jgi:electron-transferring-flavoprotein dehydrogenase